MDHLPTPVDRKHHDTVKFYHGDDTVFSPGDFFAIPKRYGYEEHQAQDEDEEGLLDENLIRKGLYKPMTVEVANEFLQEWLFFGLLADVSGQKVVAKDFYDGDSTIHTASLNTMLEKWGAAARGESEQSAEQRKIQYIRGSLALDYARAFVSQHLAYKNLDGEPNEHIETEELTGIHAEVDRNLTLSIAILGETLQKARPELAPGLQDLAQFWTSPNAQDQRWGNSVRCRQKMIERGWCLRDIRRIEATMPGVTGVYYASAIETMGSDINHKDHGCTYWDCKVQPQNLEPMHSSSCRPHECTPVNIADQELAIVQALKDGKTPLVTWDRIKNKPTLEFHKLDTSEVRFGALSHAWSERIFDRGPDMDGNHGRAVFKCQLKNLQEGFNYLIRNRHNEPDGTAQNENGGNVPFFVDILCFPRKASKTAAALRQMKTVFQKAESVIVWDRNLLEQQLREEDKLIEVNIRIRTGAWSRRLWTLQEAVLAKDLQFQFEGDKSFLSMEALANAMTKAKGVLDIAHPYHHIWRSGRPLGPAIYELRRAGKEHRVARLWQAVQFRQCSSPEDEPLILANILGGVDLDRLEAINRGTKKQIADARMAILLELINLSPGLGIPSGIIFVPGERLIAEQEQIGKRAFEWAPKTWLSQQVNNVEPLRKTARLMRNGLEVRFPGIKLHLPLQAFKASTFWIPTHHSLNKWFKVKVNVDDRDWDQFYQDNMATADEICIILSTPSAKLQWEVGMLVGSKGRLHDDVRWVYLLARVWVQLETNTDIVYKMQDVFRRKKDWMAMGERLPNQQKWLIDDFHTYRLKQQKQ